jgi:hypothetical protein
MADTPVFLYVATYGSEADAHADYKAVKALHKDHVAGTYDAVGRGARRAGCELGHDVSLPQRRG